MRERTPSADDTPKRAPPAPSREADVAGSKTSSEAVEVFHTAKFSPTTTASPTTTGTTTASSPTNVDARMVASTHNLDDLGVSHPASANSDRQQQQEKHGHAYRSAQTAQDKRSRLSNVINNLRKKVPDSRSGDSPRKEEDDRNSVERNLETLEKYVMTVLNGVIKDEEDDDKEMGEKKEAEKGKESDKLTEEQEDEDFKRSATKFEPSKPHESRTETAASVSDQSEKTESVLSCDLVEEFCTEYQNEDENVQQDEKSNCSDVKDNQEVFPDGPKEREEFCKAEIVQEEESSKNNKCSSKERKLEEQEAMPVESQEEEKENRSLGTIIMERLSDHQSGDKGSIDVSKEDLREFAPENVELRNVCRDLLNDLLNGINQLIDENSQETEETKPSDNWEQCRDSKSQEIVMTSLHCSLPLDKVASVLQNCQTNEINVPQSSSSPPSSSPPSSSPPSSSPPSSSCSQGSKSPSKPPSPTVRHLCLYCDRKFLSISLRQRHTERVHQQGGGRRSERNSRKPSQNCQYCSDKCAESLEGLFQHMVGTHGDKYHACVQCATRYLTREALVGHMNENHGGNVERTLQIQEKMKEPSPCKELGKQSPRDKSDPCSLKERKSEEAELEHRTESILLKPIVAVRDNFNNPGSPEFDSSFYSSVSCNIRENLLHHLDGKLQSSSSSLTLATSSIVDSKSQQQPSQQQSFYEHNVNQIQFPIDISLTAATPVYSKEYTNEDYENSSEYAQKPGKSNRSHPRRVSFEKYNFPRKYDGKEQWTCSIKDLSRFDISTQLTLRKKQQLLKERITLNRLHQIPILGPSETTDITQDEQNIAPRNPDESGSPEEVSVAKNNAETYQPLRCEAAKSAECTSERPETKFLQATEFSMEFGNFLRLRKWDEKASNESVKKQEVVYAELTGEWSRPRVYICGACASKHVTLKEMEDHKASSHPNVWCSHFEFSGDQRELYKHLFLPGRDVPTPKSKSAFLLEKVCTKCSKNCNTLPELHRHMLECGGDQAWLLGLFGNGKKKCKWRPFGSRSRRRRQRGMKRNIQNSQTPRVNTPKEKQPTGPRVRPSDRESIQKMLANLPPKRSTRKVLQDSTLRAQGRLRNVQTRSRPRMVGDNSTASRMSRNKAALRNKLLKNAKSIQRNRCRIDNISAVIECVVRNYDADTAKLDDEKNDVKDINAEKNAKEKMEEAAGGKADVAEKSSRAKVMRGPRVLGKKRNVKTKNGPIKSVDQAKKIGKWKSRVKAMSKNASELNTDSNEAIKTPKSVKVVSKSTEREANLNKPTTSPAESKSFSPTAKCKPSAQATPKKKRPVDPVASLNASIKAKSQLRTQDGKFARNPNKDLTQKSPENKPIASRQLMKGANNEIGPDSSNTKSKLKLMSKNKYGDELPKRITRLSSDTDKMPTLEPAVQVLPSNEEYTSASTNDLPILSPATLSSSPEKASRGKNLTSKSSDEKENSKKGDEVDSVERKAEIINEVQGENKDQRPGKGRRAKNIAKNLEKSLDNVVVKGDAPKEESKTVAKEKLKRKSAPSRIVTAEDNKSDNTNAKKEVKQKKEEGIIKSLETRSSSKEKLDKQHDDGSSMNIQNVPFEVKKLIGSDSKEDLLTKLVLAPRTATSKRRLRQPVSRFKTEQGKMKVRKYLDSKKAKLDTESVSDVPTKKDRLDARRKSLRNTEKKLEKDKVALKDDKLPAEEVDKIRDTVAEVKTAIRGRRSSSLSNENKSTNNASETLPLSGQTKAEVESTTQGVDNESTSNRRQTRGSALLNSNDGEAESKETSNELDTVSLKKITSLGKRRGRIKSSNDVPDKQNAEVSETKDEEFEKNNLTDMLDKSDTTEETKPHSDNDEITSNKDNNAVLDKEEEIENVVNTEQETNGSLESMKMENVSLNVNHVQLETSNSIDSGKENTLETTVVVQKAKVGRPRKSWGSRREKTSKRTLNNVIGILTEGMNIPVEMQQSVILTVQTSVNSLNPDGAVQNNGQQPEDGNFGSISSDKTDNSSENDVPETASNPDQLTIEIPSCVQNSEVSQQMQTPKDPITKHINEEDSSIDQKLNSSSDNSKEQPSTNDIILDLSRRKQKGKGSFLEKIVSKIAKQKDALLEGEVASLLDTAADELTSILDEVAPNFPENADTAIKKSKTEKKIQNNPQNVEEKSIDSEVVGDEHHVSLPVSNISDEKLESTNTNIDGDRTLENEEKNPRLEEAESPKGSDIDTENQIETQLKSPNEETSNQHIEDKLPNENNKAEEDNPSGAQEETCSKDLKVDQVSVDPNVIPNGLHVPTSKSVLELPLNSLSEVHSPKQEDKSLKKGQESVTVGTKLRRKSKKRSFGGNSPKKNKKKSIQPTENSEESQVPEELHLPDIMKLIDKSNHVPSTKENIEIVQENVSAKAAIEEEQPNKRKTINSDLELENSVTTEDSPDILEKLNVDTEKDIEEHVTENEENKSVTVGNDILDSTQIVMETDEQCQVNSEETNSLTIRITGKRKSYANVAEQSLEIESPVRRSSKRRFLLGEKTNQLLGEETLSKTDCEPEEPFETMPETTRRRSSRTKCVIQSKNEEEAQKETENVSVPSINNIVAKENPELLVENSLETNESAKTDSAVVHAALHSTEKAEVIEDLNLTVTQKQDMVEEGTIENHAVTDLKTSEHNTDTLVVPKVPKKRGRKKKCLTNEHVQLSSSVLSENPTSTAETQPTDLELIGLDKVVSRKSLRTNKCSDEIEGANGNSRDATNSQIATSCLEHFKIPEVTEVLHHTKKRTSKRKSTVDDHFDTQSSIVSAEPEMNTAECAETSRVPLEKEEQSENTYRKDTLDVKKRSSRNSNQNEMELQRSHSSGSIDLTQMTRTRSSKRKQLSSENLPDQSSLNRRTESVDNLSETSCVSESSYFRKKRFSKKKKEYGEHPEDVQTDTSITDSESIDAEKHNDRRQSLKRRAKNNLCFYEGDVDFFDIPMDIHDCLRHDEVPEYISQELESEPTTVGDKIVEEAASEDVSDRGSEENVTEKNEEAVDPEKTIVEEQESKEMEKADVRSETTPQMQEDFQTPKKRAAGNFVVVHKKTGEILIVEKRKKLTKEAARFFCDICATSFTRKSSLKKHNLSQSHLLQVIKSQKDKTLANCSDTADEVCDDNRNNEISSEDNNSLTDESFSAIQDVSKDDQDLSKDLESVENEIHPSASMESEEFMDSRITRQRMEDELLDEEICKITENMSHDEYVLTEHTSPGPESTSTPIQTELKKTEQVVKKKKHEKKKEKAKKNLADEHLALDTPEPEMPLNSMACTALDTDTSVEILNSITKDTVDHSKDTPSLADYSIISSAESTIDTSIQEEDNVHGKHSEDLDVSNEYLDIAVETAVQSERKENSEVIENVEQEKEQRPIAGDFNNKEYVFEENPMKSAENSPQHILDDKSCEPSSLKFVRNEDNLERSESNRSIEHESSEEIENVCHSSEQEFESHSETVENKNSVRCDNNEKNADLNSIKSLENDSTRSLVDVEVLNIPTHTVHNIGGEESDTDLCNQQSPITVEDKTENGRYSVVSVESESMRTVRHSKSKKGKVTKNVEEIGSTVTDPISRSNDRIMRKTPTSKSNQNRQVFDEVAEILTTINDKQSIECPETFEHAPFDEMKIEQSQLLLTDSDCANDSEKLSSVIIPEELENECKTNRSEIIEEQQTFYPDAEIQLENSGEPSLNEPLEESQDKLSEECSQGIDESEKKLELLHSDENNEVSSSSSLTDKPLSQLLLETNKNEEKEQESLNYPEHSEESRTDEKLESQDVNSKTTEFDENVADTNDLTINQKLDNEELINNEHIESRIVSEEECEAETVKSVKNYDTDTKVSSDSENCEIPTQSGNIEDENKTCDKMDAKRSSNVRKSSQSVSKKASKSYKHHSKDSHRKSKAKKTSVRSKIADLISDSDDNENEDKTESQNKNKIVKCVFGRVFGSEKADKVKEVLNDWVSKSEDDSDVSRTGLQSANSNEMKALEAKSEDRNVKKHPASSPVSSNPKKRSGRKSKKSTSSEKVKDKNSVSENHDEHRPSKHVKSKNGSNNFKKNLQLQLASYHYSLVLPPTSCRSSKKRAEERISKALEDDVFDSKSRKPRKSLKQKETNYGLRNQAKPDLTIKDSDYGSFNYDEDSSKLMSTEDFTEEDQIVERRMKSSTSRKGKGKNDDEDWRDLIEKSTVKSTKESGDEDDCSIKDFSEKEATTNRLSVDLDFSHSCSSLAPSSVRNRSPSMDRNSQTTRESDIEEEEVVHGRISPLFVCETPKSSVDNSSNSEGEHEEENMAPTVTVARKRSSSEFSGEKIVIRSPSSTHKTEVVTITPTDAIEDNALDVPQEIETAKPRQGKVLNFDEELFVECCSRLKATTENELRGAKKIKLDHNESFHRKDDQQQGFRGPRDKWRDVESQNSLGSLLESVNQLLGEEMYSVRERDYSKRGGRNLRSEHSSRSVSPDMSRADNLGYEDSLDVAFEHNNKLRDKIQQRMRESENLIASTFGQKSSNENADSEHSLKNDEQEHLRSSYTHSQDQGHPPGSNLSNGGYDSLHDKGAQEQNPGKMNLDSSGFKSKMNSALGGLLDKALSNLLHNNGKHDHNGSTPMKVLAELACARAPTSTAGDLTSQEEIQSLKTASLNKDSTPEPSLLSSPKDPQKKARNPIKELFEKKKELNEKKQQEKSKIDAALRELNVHRQRKTKKTKKHQDFPLIRRNEHGGLAERKKRRDGFKRKEEFASSRIKDVYDFDEEESQMEPNLGSVMSYRSRPGYEVSCLRTKEVDVAGLMSKAIGDSLENGKTGDALSTRLESMIDRKFKELEKFAPKTKGALKAFQSEEQRQITGPMDEFVERKQQRSNRLVEQTLKHSKLKKRSKNLKKKTRNAWYEYDSSDEYRTAVKTEDIGVGISKSQRTCSKGKQNLFAELYTSSESDFDEEDIDYESNRQRRVKKGAKKVAELRNVDQTQELINKYCSENEDHVDEWSHQDLKNESSKNDCDNKKSESEMSDHPLVIDERKDADDQRNSDEETENQYDRTYVLDDLYREDSSVANSDIDESTISKIQNVPKVSKVPSPTLPQEVINDKIECAQEDELIPLEEALDLLDQVDNNLEIKSDTLNRETNSVEPADTIEATNSLIETFNPVEELTEKSPIAVEDQDEEPDNDVLSLPEKLSSNEKPQKESENLPLHVFLSRKVQESKKRKEQQLKKIQEEQERILMDFQPTRRQRKCAIGKQGLLAEISSSDEEIYPRDRKNSEKSDPEKPRKQKRESKEKRKERYIEKKHEQMIAKEQKAIEEEILRELGKKKEFLAQTTVDTKLDNNDAKEQTNSALTDNTVVQEQVQKKKHLMKEKQRKSNKTEEDVYVKNSNESLDNPESSCNQSVDVESNEVSETKPESPRKQKKHSKSPTKLKKTPKADGKLVSVCKKGKTANADKSKNRTETKGSKDKERRPSSGKRDSDDEELKTTKSWNKVEEGVGVAIGRRKRAAANQLYYWSSSSDEEEMLEVVPTVEEEEDDRQEQHGWIVGDSHKRMITMLAMEKQLKEKRRRSEDEFETSKAKSKKHRNSTS